MFARGAVFLLLCFLVLFKEILTVPLSFPDAATNTEGLISVAVVRKPNGIVKRSTISSSLAHDVSEGAYFIDIGVGTPPQTVSVQLDSGSTDTWVFTPAACKTVKCIGGSFDNTTSSTFQAYKPHNFTAKYVDGSGSTGDFILETLTVGGATIESVQIGYATQASGVAYGLMGVGFDVNERGVNLYPATKYPSVLDDMVTQGLIPGRSFSLWLDDFEASTGTILFGGYDSSKVSGTFLLMEMMPGPTGIYREFLAQWTSLSIANNSDTGGTPTMITEAGFQESAVLDSGTTKTYIPADLFNTMQDYFKVTYKSNTYYISCDVRTWHGGVDFGFGFNGPNFASEIVIRVPFTEVAIQSSQAGTCFFAFRPIKNEPGPILGDTFLRSAYVYYDLDNLQIAIGQSKFV